MLSQLPSLALLIVGFVAASPTQVCNSDNCLRQLRDARYSSLANAFCATYTTAIITNPSSIPTYLGNCQNSPARVSSACYCLSPATSSTSSSTTSSTASSSVTSSSTSSTTSSSSTTSVSTTTTTSSTSTSTSASSTSYALVNSGFDNSLSPWSPAADGVIYNSDAGHDSPGAVNIDFVAYQGFPASAYISQSVSSLCVGTPYSISGWYFVNEVPSAGIVTCKVYFSNRDYSFIARSPALITGAGWTQLQATWTPSVTSDILSVGANCGAAEDGSGEVGVYVDDVTMSGPICSQVMPSFQ